LAITVITTGSSCAAGFTAAAALAGAFFVAGFLTDPAALATVRVGVFFFAGLFLVDVFERMTDLTP
jgi:hypothetical protein